MGFRDDKEALDAKVRAQEQEIEALRQQVDHLRSSRESPLPSTNAHDAAEDARSPDEKPMGAFREPSKYQGYWRRRFLGGESKHTDANDEVQLPWWVAVLILLVLFAPMVMPGSCTGCSSCLPREPLSGARPIELPPDHVASVAKGMG